MGGLLLLVVYRNTLLIAMSLGDRALEAQACYSLGNTYTLLRQYERSVEYHMQHLHIARELRDMVGESRACWSLGNAYTALGRTDLALHYTSLHLDISRQVVVVVIAVAAAVVVVVLSSHEVPIFCSISAFWLHCLSPAGFFSVKSIFFVSMHITSM